ncbi:MAG: SDR family NAD(P)-dependent oxidoreductase [Spirochaetes bacterium]|nr:SDR family NAD(P)-dependent oxidoreductase [Spirochaetota bacterium]
MSNDEKGRQQLDIFAGELLLFQFQRMGVFTKSGERISISDLKKIINNNTKYFRLLVSIVSILEKSKFISLQDQIISTLPEAVLEYQKNNENYFEQEKERLELEYPGLKHHINLLYICLNSYPQVLTGEWDSMEVLFPGGSKELLAGIYRGDDITQFFNQTLARIIQKYIQLREEEHTSRQINILEIGAGTGGTSEIVLDAVAGYGDKLNYSYTDISMSFVLEGKKKFSSIYSFTKFFKLDIEKTEKFLKENHQNLLNQYDIIFGTNVFHATKNINQTLNNVKIFLKENGLFLLNETTTCNDFNTLIFGLTDGWWLYDDENIRIKNSPLLTDHSWQDLLQKNGFRNVKSLNHPEFNTTQNIILGENDDKYHLENIIDGSSCASLSEESNLDELVIDYIKGVFSEVLSMEKEELDPESSFDIYGVDSLVSLEIKKHFQKRLGRLPAVLLFENTTIKMLARSFIENHRDKLQNFLIAKSSIKKLAETSESKNNKNKVTSSVNKNIIEEDDLRPENRNNYEVKQINNNDIAVTGLSCRFPQAEDQFEFWENLKKGKNCITEIPRDRWNWQENYAPGKIIEGKIKSKWGGFITDVDKFDPLFFNISPREAEEMDPQERLFLQISWSVLEDAGYFRSIKEEREKNVGVFTGIMNNDYEWFSSQSAYHGKFSKAQSKYWSVANRVSYFMNFTGPSIAIDTACSSSLTAIHLACESIKRGECETAIAGGVNLILCSIHYKRLSAINMITSDNKLKAFGEGADGFIAGEGVGAVYLKPLKKAISDRDLIYGIIKGSAINSGGRTSGYTVPNPHAQAMVIKQAFQQANVEPKNVTYIEAHGTGTSLGDPIEIKGLSKVFNRDNDKIHYCAIGSVKSNIGHLESAAGIAGFIKVLLQLKHQMLVPSLHSEFINSEIDLAGSPFYIQKKLSQWDNSHSRGDQFSRIAGISSFGAGGVNAHVVVEEYIPVAHQNLTGGFKEDGPVIVVLSAKNVHCLRKQAKQLLAFITSRMFSKADLFHLAYTLQVTRESMEARLGLIVNSLHELEEKLSTYLNELRSIDGIYQGHVKTDKEKLKVFNRNKNVSIEMNSWFANKEYDQLLRFWSIGGEINWNKLDQANSPILISLPTYPFARERYWVPEVENTNYTKSIHPLVHENTSDLSMQRFSSFFTGEESFFFFFFVQGQRVLPGAAYLEMARFAASQGIGFFDETERMMQIKDVTWLNPLNVGDQAVQIHIGLYSEDTGDISFKIYGGDKNINKDTVIYSQGRVALKPMTHVPVLDMADLLENCKNDFISKEKCYEIFKTININYGSTHQGIQEMFIGDNKVLARIALPPSVIKSSPHYVLHPSIIDSSFQVSLGLLLKSIESAANLKTFLPFTLDELDIFGTIQSEMWAVVKYSNNFSESEKIHKVDINLCDLNGKTCIRMKGFASLPFDRVTDNSQMPVKKGILLLKTQWTESKFRSEKVNYVNHYIVLWGRDNTFTRVIEKKISQANCIELKTDADQNINNYEIFSMQLFEEVKKVLLSQPRKKILFQVLISSKKETSLLACFSALLKTAHLENPNFIWQLIEIEETENHDLMIKSLQDNLNSNLCKHIKYQERKCYVADLVEMIDEIRDANNPWKDKGIYLITGGIGGLGTIFAGEIIGRVKDSTLILTGRSYPDESITSHIKNLEALGGKVIYQQVDVSNRKAVFQLMKWIKQEIGDLNGIIHSAGIIRDNFIINKSSGEFQKVIAPKISGVVNLDLATKDYPLDFFILFSSGSGVLGNTGQADYCCGNAFMDAYAGYRNQLITSGMRYGQTTSFNWPLWKDGGMQVAEVIEKSLHQNFGLEPMSSANGISAFYRGLSAKNTQVMVVNGDINKMRQTILENYFTFQSAHQSKTRDRSSLPALPDHLLKEKGVSFFKKTLSSVIKLPVNQIESDVPLEEYGIDSVMILQMTNELEKSFGLLSKTLFFENQNIDELTQYFIENHQDQLLKQLNLENNNENFTQIEKANPWVNQSFHKKII